MDRDDGSRARRDAASSSDDAPAPAGGKRTRVAAAYPTLARALRQAGAGDRPDIHDAATAAVAGKGGGAAVDQAVAAQVGAHLDVDLAQVRVHQDPLAQEASAAMGARAFAHGQDVFLGAGESGSDLGLMAHELTHVAQQGAAGRRAPQRKIEVGAADSPAEHQADAVASAVTGGAAPAALIVDDGPVAPGQMLKSTFIALLRQQVTAAADAELGPVFSAMGCPYIDQYFGRYGGRPAADGEAMLRRYAPGARGATTAAAMIPLVVDRVRDGIRHWRDTGQAPPEVASLEPAAAAAAATSGAQALRSPDGGESLASLEAALGPGQPLDGATASRMAGALGVDVSAARIHVGAVADRKAVEAGALAFAAGPNIVLRADAPSPGSLEGDALLAHELAHTAQQAGAAADPVARRRALGDQADHAEHDADAAAAAAVAHLHGGASATAQRVRSASTGLQLQRCNGGGTTPAASLDRVPAGHARDAATQLAASTVPIEQNTARLLSTGALKCYYFDTLAHAPNENAILAAQSPPLDPALWAVLVHPERAQNMIVQRNAVGFRLEDSSNDIFGQSTQSVDRWKTLLVHEVNHARNPIPGTVVERYQSEFRAYWLAEYSGVADLDDRARQVKAHILRDYPAISAAYNADNPTGTRAAIDGHTRPAGNLDNH
ncbi:MAG: DUF4157 domain-containing protein [Kofleriaceae bacterium]